MLLVFHICKNAVSFDDSEWPSAVSYYTNEEIYKPSPTPQFSTNCSFISVSMDTVPQFYCRLKLC